MSGIEGKVVAITGAREHAVPSDGLVDRFGLASSRGGIRT
jgi:hypothetical protein